MDEVEMMEARYGMDYLLLDNGIDHTTVLRLLVDEGLIDPQNYEAPWVLYNDE